jgi:hypothetical protein
MTSARPVKGMALPPSCPRTKLARIAVAAGEFSVSSGLGSCRTRLVHADRSPRATCLGAWRTTSAVRPRGRTSASGSRTRGQRRRLELDTATKCTRMAGAAVLAIGCSPRHAPARRDVVAGLAIDRRSLRGFRDGHLSHEARPGRDPLGRAPKRGLAAMTGVNPRLRRV